MIVSAAPAAAQQPRVYAGGALALHTQTHSESKPLGGTCASGSALFGVWLSRRAAVEVEPTFGPAFSSQYSYRPGPSLTANVDVSRRDTSLLFQLRIRAGALQPVVGAGFAHGHVTRHATLATGATYFDDESSDEVFTMSAGVDAPLRVAPHVEVFPTLRLLFTGRNTAVDGLVFDQAATGSLAVRYGVGAKLSF
jgi:hypothetical protein